MNQERLQYISLQHSSTKLLLILLTTSIIVSTASSANPSKVSFNGGCIHTCKYSGVCPEALSCCNDTCCRSNCTVYCNGAACLTDHDCGTAYNCVDGCCKLRNGWFFFNF